MSSNRSLQSTRGAATEGRLYGVRRSRTPSSLGFISAYRGPKKLQAALLIVSGSSLASKDEPLRSVLVTASTLAITHKA